jgi:hypothetical protein
MIWVEVGYSLLHDGRAAGFFQFVPNIRDVTNG